MKTSPIIIRNKEDHVRTHDDPRKTQKHEIFVIFQVSAFETVLSGITYNTVNGSIRGGRATRELGQKKNTHVLLTCSEARFLLFMLHVSVFRQKPRPIMLKSTPNTPHADPLTKVLGVKKGYFCRLGQGAMD